MCFIQYKSKETYVWLKGIFQSHKLKQDREWIQAYCLPSLKRIHVFNSMLNISK